MTLLDIISDPICPWCYIGKTRLDRALAQRPAHPFRIAWHPFQLNPDMPPEGMDRRAYLEAKFGGPEGAARVYGRIEDVARETGLALDFDRIARTPNTIDAHRLIHWAEAESVQGEVVDALFKRYFEAGEDISDHGVLEDVARTAGFAPGVVARLLATDADTDEIRGRDAAVREMGVTGVPTFLVDRRHAVSGAQDTEFWLHVIDVASAPTEAGHA